MKTYYINRKAFTMIELIMVIVILGIVASIGSSLIADVYKSYLMQRATHRATLKTELAAQQIANLLSYRMPGTTLARNPGDLTDNRLVTDATNEHDIVHTLLEWIGADSDGFSAALLPPWNGFCDLAASSQSNIVTPGSNLVLANTIISNLSYGSVSLTGASNPAIFFRTDSGLYAKNSAASAETYYNVLADSSGNPACMGVTDSNVSCISSVSIPSTMTPADPQRLFFTTVNNANVRTDKVIAEHYKLAWTAYAIRPVPKANGLFDLVLYYNYQPWEGGNLNAGWPATSATIITNVSVFKFAESGNTFRFKICAQENIGENFNITICKEKAVVL